MKVQARDCTDPADAIDFLGASLSTGSSFDASTISHPDADLKLDDALPLMADVALRPAFSPTELDRLQERLTTLLQTRDNAAGLAAVAFSGWCSGRGTGMARRRWATTPRTAKCPSRI